MFKVTNNYDSIERQVTAGEAPPLRYGRDMKLSKVARGPDGEIWTGIYNNLAWGEDPTTGARRCLGVK